MVSSIRFKPRQIVAMLGILLLAFGTALGVTAQSAKAASSAGIPYSVVLTASPTPGFGVVTLTLTQDVGVINGTITPEATITLNGTGTLGVGGKSVSIPIVGKTGDVLPAVRYKCVTADTTITVLGYEATPFPVVITPGAVIPSCGGVPPVVDTDGDGVPDATDACPTVPAATANGCPDVVPPPADDGDTKTVTFCHATGQDDKFVLKTTSINAFYREGHNTHQDGRDKVPPFTRVKNGETVNFPGMNWDAAAEAFLKNGCAAVEETVPNDPPTAPDEPKTPVTPDVPPVKAPVVPAVPSTTPVTQVASTPVQVPAVQSVVPAVVTPAESQTTSAQPLAYGPDISQQSLGEVNPSGDTTQLAVSKGLFIGGLLLLMVALVRTIQARRPQRQ